MKSLCVAVFVLIAVASHEALSYQDSLERSIREEVMQYLSALNAKHQRFLEERQKHPVCTGDAKKCEQKRLAALEEQRQKHPVCTGDAKKCEQKRLAALEEQRQKHPVCTGDAKKCEQKRLAALEKEEQRIAALEQGEERQKHPICTGDSKKCEEQRLAALKEEEQRQKHSICQIKKCNNE